MPRAVARIQGKRRTGTRAVQDLCYHGESTAVCGRRKNLREKEGSVRFGIRADQPSAAEAFRVIAGFACNQGFAFSLFYLGTNQAFGGGPFAFERADLFGTLLSMVAAFALLRAASPRARDALLARPLLWCYAGLLVVGSLVPALAEAGQRASSWRACSWGRLRASCWRHGDARWAAIRWEHRSAGCSRRLLLLLSHALRQRPYPAP